jgi:hypothetical protein
MLVPASSGDVSKADSLFTMYLSMVGTVAPSKAKKQLGLLAAGVQIPAGKGPTAAGANIRAQ